VEKQQHQSKPRIYWPELGDDCIHTLTFEAWDNLDNYYGEHKEHFYVDNTPPEITKEISEPKYKGGLPNGDGYIRNDTRIWVNVTDVGVEPCIVGSTHLNLSILYKNNWYYKTLDNSCGPIHYNFTFEEIASELGLELADDCVHELHLWAEDNLGNRNDSYAKETFYVDNQPPETTKTIDEPFCPLEGTERLTIFYDNFKYPCGQRNPMLHGWIGDYFGNPSTENIWNDIDSTWSHSTHGWVAGIKDDAAMIRTISTKGFENIEFSYCRRTADTNPGDQLRIGWKVGEYNDDNDWNNWNELEAIRELWDCVSFTLPAEAEDQDYISIAFFMDDGNGDHGWVDNVKVTGDYINQPYYWVTTHTNITLTAEDLPDEPCKSGVKELFFEAYYDDNDNGYADEPVELDIIEDNLPEYVTFRFQEECLHKIVWYAVDNLGNKEVLMNMVMMYGI